MTSGGTWLTIIVTPTVAASGGVVALSLSGAFLQTVTSAVAVGVNALAEGPFATTAAAALSPLVVSAGDAAAAALTSRASAAAEAFRNSLASASFKLSLTAAAANALDGEARGTVGTAVRNAGLVINGVTATSAPATLSPPVVGAIALPSAAASAKAGEGGFINSFFYYGIIGGAVIMLVVAIGLRRRAAALAHRAAARSDDAQFENPLRARHPPPGNPPKHAKRSFQETLGKKRGR